MIPQSNKYNFIRTWAVILIVMMCIRYIPIETRASISPIKVLISALCPFVILWYSPKITKIDMLCFFYCCFMFILARINYESFRWSTLLFHYLYIITFLTYYHLLVYEKVFSKDFFINFLRNFILAYTILLLVQQFFIIIGIKIFPIINLCQFLDRGIGANSLSGEPATFSVVLAFSFMALLRMHELTYGRRLSLSEIYFEEKWVLISFLWCMISMASGTAFFALGILCLYFFRFKYILSTIALIILISIIINFVDFTPLERAKDSFMAFLTLDVENVKDADGSAAARIVPIVNTLTKSDLSSTEFWFGHGIDYGLSKGLFSERVMIGNISDYGFLYFILVQVIVYSCMIRKIFSLETIFWVVLGFATLANTPPKWGVMMIFAAVRYFQIQKENGCLDNHSEL